MTWSSELGQVEAYLKAMSDGSARRTTEAAAPEGFAEVERQPLLVCTTKNVSPATPIPGLEIVELTKDSDLSVCKENLDLNAKGFDPHAADTPDAEAEEFRQGMGEARAFTARLHGKGVAAGMYLPITNSVTELVGIATLEDMRSQGIAQALTTAMTHSALSQGAAVVFLMTDNPIAQRVYERVGFQQVGQITEYVSVAAKTADLPIPIFTQKDED